MRHVRLCCLTLVALLLALPAASLADGGGNDNSAGDNQYVDPLAGSTPAAKPKPKPKASTPSTTSSSTPTTTPSTTTPSTSSPSAPTTASSAPKRHSGKALPYTGAPAFLIAALGGALLAAGLALRRSVRA